MGRALVEDDDLKDFYRILKASSAAQAADKEKDPEKREKLLRQERRLKSKLQKEEALTELFELFDAEMMTRMEKPALQDNEDSSIATPQRGDLTHPVIQKRDQVDDLRKQGNNPISAHQEVFGEVDLGNIESKAKVAGTLGRVQQKDVENGIRIEKDAEFKSILAVDAEIEDESNQTTHNDLRTPMPAQVPDKYQTPEQQVSEELDIAEEIDYHEFDVAYLQTFGRA